MSENSKISTYPRRSSLRTAERGVFVEAMIVLENGESLRVDFFPENVSRGGLLFRWPSPLPETARLNLQMYLATLDQPVVLEARVLRQTSAPDGSIHMIAVEFVDPPRASQRKILQFALSRLLPHDDYALLFVEDPGAVGPNSAN